MLWILSKKRKLQKEVLFFVILNNVRSRLVEYDLIKGHYCTAE